MKASILANSDFVNTAHIGVLFAGGSLLLILVAVAAAVLVSPRTRRHNTARKLDSAAPAERGRCHHSR